MGGSGLLRLFAGLNSKRGIFVVVDVFLVIFVIINISILGGAGGLTISLLLHLLLLLFLELDANGLAIKPVDDLQGVHGVLRVMLENENHLLLGGGAVVHEEARRLAFGVKGRQGRRFFRCELGFGGLDLLTLLAATAAECRVKVWELFITSDDSCGNELRRTGSEGCI